MKNPYIQPHDYFKGYNESIEKLKNDPTRIEMDKLCYALFHEHELGKKFMELVEERYLMPALAQVGTPDYATRCIWAEGFKEAFRLLKNSVKQHKQRIKSEADNK